MGWETSLSTFAWIFPVGRGNAAFLRSALNHGFILDMGGGELIDPVAFIRKHFLKKLSNYPEKEGKKVAQAILSHAHSDHIRQCAHLGSGDFYPTLLTCPNEKTKDEKLDWDRIENPEGDDDQTDSYKKLYAERNPPLQTILYESKRTVPNLEYGIYYVAPPMCHKLHEAESANNEYGNSTSIMFYLRQGNHSVLFPGDMTPEGMKHVLEERLGMQKRFTRFKSSTVPAEASWHTTTGTQPSLKSQLKTHGLTILVAPHHGLESCYSTHLYDAIRRGKPNLVILSERRKRHENDGSTDARYQGEQGAVGVDVEIEGKTERNRRSLSTKDGHHILIVFSGTGLPKVYADKTPENLLKKLL
jgi:hypothetical protein